MQSSSSVFNQENKFFILVKNLRDIVEITKIQELYLSLLFLKHLNEVNQNVKNNIIVLPDCAKWSNIISINDNIGNELYKIFFDLEDKNEILNGIFSTFNFERLPSDKAADNDLLAVIQHISELNLIDSNMSLGNIFDKTLIQHTIISGKKGVGYMQPLELTCLMNSFLPQKRGLSIYNPFAGLASLAMNLPDDAKYYGQEINRNVWAIGKLRILAHNLNDRFQLLCEDSVDNWLPEKNNQKFDIIIANPPFGQRRDHGTEDRPFKDVASDFIYNAINSLTPNGKVIAVVSNSFLFNSINSSLRKEFIDRDLIEYIISFPGGLFQHTGISFSLVVLNNNKKSSNKVTFVNAEKFVKKISKRENKIKVNALVKSIEEGTESDCKIIFNLKEICNSGSNYNLSANRFFISDSLVGIENMTSLKNILAPAFAHSLASIVEGKFIRIRDLSDDIHKFQKDFDDLEDIEILTRPSMVPNNKLLIAKKGASLKPTFYKSSGNTTIYYSQSDILALSVDEDKVNIEYLVNELYSDYVQEQIKKYRTGITVTQISINDLFNVKIKLPTLEEQKAKVRGFKEALILEKKRELDYLKKIHGLENEIFEQNSFLRHSIAGPLSNLQGSIDDIKAILNEKVAPFVDGLMDIKETPESEITLGNYLDILKHNIEVVIQKTKSISHTDNKESEIDFKSIGLISFLEHYISETKVRSNLNFSIVLQLDQDSIIDGEIDINDICILGNELLLKELLDNLIENADIHAFDKYDSSKNRIELYLSFNELNNSEVWLLVSNTGKSFPKQFSLDMYIKKGAKTGYNSGDGNGGYRIYEIIKLHGGSLDIIDERGSEGVGVDLATSFEIIFPFLID